ncbi:riboflavin synthase domain-like protein [Xylariaceae sp. FL0255]|nr:riboflavin synthase domain-like protein [Xylariaceae sp. FL0255]
MAGGQEEGSPQNGNGSNHGSGVSVLNDRRMLVLYGSETGNSEEAAGEIESMGRRLHFRTDLEEMNDVKLSGLLQYSLVVFVISTTGRGDIPRNARAFWKSLLRKRLPPDCLSQVKFTTFGLGDSSYTQYNWAARKLHKRLEQLGAVEFLPRGEADERHDDGVDGTFIPWCLTLKSYLDQNHPLPPDLQPIPIDAFLEPKFILELSEPTPAMSDSGDNPQEDQNGDRSKPEMDNQGHLLDSEAALFSHVDNSPKRNDELRYQHRVVERMSSQGNVHAARASEGTASTIRGGIDTIDRPNVLKDFATKYSLEDHSVDLGKIPNTAVIPIPGSLVGMVEENRRLTPESHWQDVRHVTMRFHRTRGLTGELERWKHPPIYTAGDVAIIYPKNYPEDVQTLINLQGWNDVADKEFRHLYLHSKDSDDIPMMPKGLYTERNYTLRDLLTHNYDITSIPRRSFFHRIHHYTDDITHKERLKEFTDPLLSEEFWDYTSRPRRSILEVLQDFPSVRIPHQQIPGIFPIIRGREYSIISGGDEVTDDTGCVWVDILVALVKYKTVLRKTRQGLCSRYISTLPRSTPIAIEIRENHIPRAIRDPFRDLLVIATGTGIAPMRSLILQREAERMQENHESGGRTVIFFGGRNRSADFYFEKEWIDLEIQVITAFSRDQPQKIYIQDRIREHFELICQMFRRDAGICLCGSSGKMPEAVKEALCDAAVMGGIVPNRETARANLSKIPHLFWEEVW